MKRTLVSLPNELFDIMKTKLMGKSGESDSEIIRSIVIAYLSQQGYLSNKPSNCPEDGGIKEVMITALMDALEEKGVIRGKDIDNRIRRSLQAKSNLTTFDDLK